MAKQGMKRPEISKKPKNEAYVPALQGKAKSGKEKAKPIIAETMGAEQRVWHEPPISAAHGIIDNDLARDNLENDIPWADLQDLYKMPRCIKAPGLFICSTDREL